MERYWTRRAIAAAFAVVLSALNVTAYAAGAEEEEVARFAIEKHEARIRVATGKVTLDGEPFGTYSVPVRGGRAFAPIRLLERLGVGAVGWDGERREVTVTPRPELRAPLHAAVFRVGSSALYAEDGSRYAGLEAAAPFLEGGRVYVPLQPFAYLGVQAEWREGELLLTWSVKRVNVLQPVLSASQRELQFTALYDIEWAAPTATLGSVSGGWSGIGASARSAGESEIDGRRYARIRYTVPLKPGPNLVRLDIDKVGEAVMEAHWTPNRPEEAPPETTAPLVLARPEHGYAIAAEGESVRIEGTITEENELFDTMTLRLVRYDPESRSFHSYGEPVRAPIRDNAFSGEIVAPAAGWYRVLVDSPEYHATPGPLGPVSLTWGSFVLEVRADK
ncbi:stalk domain-containing protein [Paenibacillus sp.]|uniref:stalk domain-containing protein n=1 Tax=Paenibacillus sp. TaxID=58172 RepID=UPI002D6F3D3B|nr:stalk domain-containing protein [Paenibacillus sp.]HZG57212.1 stalk domain-containing protein [Paenibacillus sp.]